MANQKTNILKEPSNYDSVRTSLLNFTSDENIKSFLERLDSFFFFFVEKDKNERSFLRDDKKMDNTSFKVIGCETNFHSHAKRTEAPFDQPDITVKNTSIILSRYYSKFRAEEHAAKWLICVSRSSPSTELWTTPFEIASAWIRRSSC